MEIVIERPLTIPFLNDFHNDEITVTTAQGLGDIFWIYQKLIHYFDKINFNIAYIEGDLNIASMRAVEWLKCFPKVNKIEMKLHDRYVCWQITQQYPNMISTIETCLKGEEVFYCCNKWLEDGVRIEDIDPGAMVGWDIPLKHDNEPLPFSEYSLLFLPKTTLLETYSATDPFYMIWNIESYVELLRLVYERYSKSWPVIVIGADFDKIVEKPTCDILTQKGFVNYSMFGENPSKVINIIKNAKLFIGYQSGLNVIADNFDIPQIMLYWPMIDKERYYGFRHSWCKKKNIGSIYCATTFDCSPREIIENLTINI